MNINSSLGQKPHRRATYQDVLIATLADEGPVSLPPFNAISFTRDALWPETFSTPGSEAAEMVSDRSER